MVSLSLPSLGQLHALAQALSTTNSAHAPALARALAAFEAASRAGPTPAPEWLVLRAVLVEVEHDGGEASGAVAKLRAACEAELAGLSDATTAAADGMPAGAGAGEAGGPVELVVNDPEGERLLEEMEGQAEDLRLSPADEQQADDPDGPSPAAAAAAKQDGPPTPVPGPGQADVGPLPALHALPTELLPLLLSAARLPSTPPTNAGPSGLSDSALLTTLVLRPTLVLPPGKTLLSLLARPPTPSSPSPSISADAADVDVDSPARKRKRQLDEVALGALGKRGKGLDGAVRALGMTMEERVGVLMKSAWWDQTADALLAPPPSTAPALKLVQLQSDLAQAAMPLLSPSTLARLLPVPLAPEAAGQGAWDSRAFARRLGEMLSTLKTVSAPVRDAEIDRLLALLSGPLFSPATPSPAPSSGSSDAAVERTRAVLRTVQGILDLCEFMRSDLAKAKIAAVPVSALPSIVRALVHAQEHDDVLAHWKPEELRGTWRAWVGASSSAAGAGGWTRRLVESVCSPVALTFLLSPVRSDTSPPSTPAAAAGSSDTNRLPLVLNASAPVLWHAQNLVQAALITALLGLLSPSSPPGLAGQLLGLLRADLLAPPSQGHTHVADLEHALVAARPEGAELDAEGRKVLRGKIDKVLRAEDPVWRLLAQRLIEALAVALAPPTSTAAGPAGPLRTGLVARSSTGAAGGEKRTVLCVKGFEGLALEEALGEVLEVLEGVRAWVGEGWPDVLRD